MKEPIILPMVKGQTQLYARSEEGRLRIRIERKIKKHSTSREWDIDNLFHSTIDLEPEDVGPFLEQISRLAGLMVLK